MDDQSPGQLFDAYYFAHCCGRPYGRDPVLVEFFDTIADRIVTDLRPTSVLDAGCAMGLLVDALRRRGVAADGIDLSDYAITQVPPAAAPFCRVGSIAEPFDRRYDLIVSIEVVEHMPPREADRAVANLAAHTDAVLFSSSPFDLREATHQSVRPTEAWAEAFARAGLFRHVDYDAGYVNAWAALFTREAPTVPGLVRKYERWGFSREYAARESRAQALETQRKLTRLEELEALAAEIEGPGGKRERLEWLERKAAELVTEVRERTLERNAEAAKHNVAQQQLDDARRTVRAMESSVFWKLRRPWAALSRKLLGR